MKKYELICMSFDGDYVSDNFEFDTIDDAWEYSNNMGSRWHFYPFHFVIRSKTVKDAPFPLDIFTNKRVATAVKAFERTAKLDEAQNMTCEEFAFALQL